MPTFSTERVEHDTRQLVERAQSALARSRGCTPEEAGVVLRDAAEAERLTIRQVAARVITGAVAPMPDGHGWAAVARRALSDL